MQSGGSRRCCDTLLLALRFVQLCATTIVSIERTNAVILFVFNAHSLFSVQPYCTDDQLSDFELQTDDADAAVLCAHTLGRPKETMMAEERKRRRGVPPKRSVKMCHVVADVMLIY